MAGSKGVLCVFFFVSLIVLLGDFVYANPEDASCLSGVKGSIMDPENKLVQWTGDKLKTLYNGTISELEGVTCNNERFFKLSFAGFSLGSTISPFISNCTNLHSLDMSANGFSGEITTELQYLVNLAVLNLSVNQLKCSIVYVWKRDPWNSIIDGVATEGFLQMRQGPRAAIFGSVLLGLLKGVASPVGVQPRVHEAKSV